jgi:N-acetyl-D-muramate 6-phosphate phosphatase
MSIAPRALLFDLDGTLVDTAVDMHAAANDLCAAHGRPPVSLEAFRPTVSKGGRAMLRLAFDEPGEALVEALLPDFLARYGRAIAVHSRLFPGMAELLEAIERGGQRWGVVSNKPEQLARGVIDGLGLSSRCAVLIGGDTLAAKKPDPLPLREACRRLGIGVQQALYVGDDRRDIDAARAAPMPSLVARWGYLEPGCDASDWGADHLLDAPRDLLRPDWVVAAGG